MKIQDLENLEKSSDNFSFVDLLEDYSRERPDRMRSQLHRLFGLWREDLLIREFFPPVEIEEPPPDGT